MASSTVGSFVDMTTGTVASLVDMTSGTVGSFGDNTSAGDEAVSSTVDIVGKLSSTVGSAAGDNTTTWDLFTLGPDEGGGGGDGFCR
jgi:hypothetical protein